MPDIDNFEPQEEMESDDLEILQNKVADQLSELSMAVEMPTEFRRPGESFESCEVDFGSSGWLLRVIQIQGWLYPSEEIPVRSAETDPFTSAKNLFAAIGVEDPSTCLQETNGVVKLNTTGADYLATRLDSALSLQQQFLDNLEITNKRQATNQWIEAWDEETEREAPAPEPIRAKSTTWSICDFSSKAVKGHLNLKPSYQRGDVWPTSDAQLLIESILRGIPLPSIILLKPKGNSQARYEVVDGKQRLTSILRFIGQHPAARQRVKEADDLHPGANLRKHFDEDYKKFRRTWKSIVGEVLTDKLESEYYFPFRLAQSSKALRGPLAPLAGKYYHEIRNMEINIADGQDEVINVFEHSSDYKIPLIEYTDASPKQIHEVFHLYNRQGKHLNAEEIRNALFHDVDLVRLVLVASGDNPAVEILAPYVPEADHPLLRNISRYLNGYSFGVARYRRTKLVSWLFALLFQSAESNGDLTIRSTAKQIDTFFSSIREKAASGTIHKMASEDVLVQLVRDVEKCLDVHSSADCWSPIFCDDDRGMKWQELQLVASLVAVFLIGVVVESPGDVLEMYRTDILTFTKNHRRPAKTQNKTQWGFIGKVAIGLLEVVGVDLATLDSLLAEKYGTSCIPTLQAAVQYHEPRQA